MVLGSLQFYSYQGHPGYWVSQRDGEGTKSWHIDALPPGVDPSTVEARRPYSPDDPVDAEIRRLAEMSAPTEAQKHDKGYTAERAGLLRLIAAFLELGRDGKKYPLSPSMDT